MKLFIKNKYELLKNASELQLLTYVSFAIYLLYSFIFYKERTCYTDSAYYIFQIIEFDSIKGGLNRFGGYIPQVPSYILYKIGLGLKSILLAFSVSYALLHFMLFLLVERVFKNKAVAYSIIFIQILSIGKSYFHCATETHIAITMSLVLYAWIEYILDSDRIKDRYSVLVSGSALIVAWGVFSHMIFILLSGFFLLYVWVDRKVKLFNPAFVSVAISFVLMFFVKFLFMETSEYDKNFIVQLKFSHELLLKLTDLYSFKYYVDNFATHYLAVTITLIITSLILIVKKKFNLLILVSGFYFFLLLLSFIIYNQGDSDIMMERSFMGQAPIAALPIFLFFDRIGNTKMRNVILVSLGIIFFTSFSRIYDNGEFYKERISYIYSLLHKNSTNKIRKAVVKPSDIDMNKVEGQWAFGIETLFLSSIDSKLEHQTIYILPEPTNYNTNSDNGKLFLGVHFWELWDADNLNDKYFIFPEEHYTQVYY